MFLKCNLHLILPLTSQLISLSTTQPLAGSYDTKVCIFFRGFSKHPIVQATAAKQSIIHRTNLRRFNGLQIILHTKRYCSNA